MELLRSSEAQGLDLKASCYSAAISCCMRAGRLEAAVALVHTMSSGYSHRIVRERFDSGHKGGAAAIDTAEVEEAAEAADALLCFQTVLSMCAKRGEADMALSLLSSLRSLGIAPSASCLSSVISACGKAGELEAALEVFRGIPMQRTRERGRLPHMAGPAGLGGNGGNRGNGGSRLNGESGGKRKGVQREQHEVSPSPRIVNAMLSACVKCEAWDVALDLFQSLDEGYHTHTTHSTEDQGPGHSAYNDGQFSESFPFDDHSLRTAAKAYRHSGREDEARLVEGRLEAGLRPRATEVGSSSPGSSSAAIGTEVVVDLPIGKAGSRAMGVVAPSAGGRSACSRITPLAFDGQVSLNRVVIDTGRTHQIRVHSASLRCTGLHITSSSFL